MTLASARDGRTVDMGTARVWADDLEDITFEEGVDALKRHYQESSLRVMPADILRHARPRMFDEWGWAN
ncbi:hypothetical protein C7K25_10370 [Gulosibacter molinativorax]|uniref:Uncharacterized protein n=2 Tax=Gulosibacter molinativorax TaxID=256821 RepID=A0ABT7C969_9MICO|nr:hypothetical protein [Gulosibacter molinativorax]